MNIIPPETLNDPLLTQVLAAKGWCIIEAPEHPEHHQVLTSFGLSFPFPNSVPHRQTVLDCLENEHQTNPEVELLREDRRRLLNALAATERRMDALHSILVNLQYAATYLKYPSRYVGMAQGAEEPRCYVSCDAPSVGDVVIGVTSGEVGILEAITPDDTFSEAYILQPAGETHTVRWVNERFKPIRGIHESTLYTGERQAFLKCLRATCKLEQFNFTATMSIPREITLRDTQARISIHPRYSSLGDEPYTITLENWRGFIHPEPTPELLGEALVAQGWGTRKPSGANHEER